MHYVVAIEAIRKHMISTQNSCHVDVAGMLANTARKSLEQAGLTNAPIKSHQRQSDFFFLYTESTPGKMQGRHRAFHRCWGNVVCVWGKEKEDRKEENIKEVQSTNTS